MLLQEKIIVRVLVVSREQIGVVNCQSRASGFNTCSLYLIWSEQQNNSFANEWMKDHIFELQGKMRYGYNCVYNCDDQLIILLFAF